MMADLAAVFGWGPPDMDDMTVAELAAWHRRALARLPGGSR